MDYKTIVRKSQESYNRFFNDIHYLPKEEEISDITIDIENMQDKIAAKAAQAKGHIAYLEQVKKEIEDQAKASEEGVFTNEHKDTEAKLNKMYDEYVEANKKLFALQSKIGKLLHK